MNHTVTHLPNGDFEINKSVTLGLRRGQASELAKDAGDIRNEARKHKSQDRAVG
jgi:hypothetical protein